MAINDVVSMYLSENDVDHYRVKDGIAYTITDEVIPISESDLISASENLAMLRLRQKRNIFISQTDWWSGSDLTMSADQTVYRQALRDLPSTSTPSLDSDGQLTGVNWPTKPE